MGCELMPTGIILFNYIEYFCIMCAIYLCQENNQSINQQYKCKIISKLNICDILTYLDDIIPCKSSWSITY